MTAAAPSVLVDVTGVSKVYQPYPRAMRLLLRSAVREPVVALRSVDLRLHEGEILAVVGPNGAGKSTLFRILTGLTTPTGGEATVVGLDATRESARVRRHVGFAPAEERTLLLRHTCRENLEFHGRLQGIPSSALAARVTETLGFVGLASVADRTGFALSTGMRARLQLARAMLHRPRVLILDEPTGSLDPLAARDFLGLVVRAAAEGAAVLISSHRLEEIEALRDRVLLLDRGRVVYEGSLDELRSRWDRPAVRLRFVDEDTARKAAGRLRGRFGRDLVHRAATVTVAGVAASGTVLRDLGVLIDDVLEVATAHRLLVDVLADVMADAAIRDEESS